MNKILTYLAALVAFTALLVACAAGQATGTSPQVDETDRSVIEPFDLKAPGALVVEFRLSDGTPCVVVGESTGNGEGGPSPAVALSCDWSER